MKLYKLRNMNWIVITKFRHELSWTKNFFTIWNDNLDIVTLVAENKVIPFIKTNKFVKVI